MELRDFFVTPLILVFLYGLAYGVRPYVTDEITRRYFIPAFTVKVIGALAVGFVYDFYYHGGDTFFYHTWGSRIVWEAFMKSPATGLKLLLANAGDHSGIYKYSSEIPFFTDPSSYMVVRISAVLDLFTFSTYSSTALLFASLCFVGMWMFFLTFYSKYPTLHKWIAFGTFFIPSLFFWGSGLLKDTITLGCIGMATYETDRIFITKKGRLGSWILLVAAFLGLYTVKIYIMLTLLPGLIIWVFLSNLHFVRSSVLKGMMFPFVICMAGGLGYYAMLKASAGDEKYSLNNIGRTAQITAYDILYYTGRNAGSGYSLGELDGTFASMLRLAPQAVTATLFRPFPWEVKNPFMLLSSLEGLMLFSFCLYVLFKRNVRIMRALFQPDVFFAFVFSISFAFAVGVSTFNFGTLVRYKIPMFPFFFIGLVLTLHHSKIETKDEELEETE